MLDPDYTIEEVLAALRRHPYGHPPNSAPDQAGYPGDGFELMASLRWIKSVQGQNVTDIQWIMAMWVWKREFLYVPKQIFL